MKTMVTFTGATLIGFHAMAYLTEHPEQFCTIKEISNVINASKHHLAKVVLYLSKEGLLTTETGPAGGIKLSKPPGEITMMDIFVAIEGSSMSEECVFGKKNCNWELCRFPNFREKIITAINEYLTTTHLSDLKFTKPIPAPVTTAS